MWKVLPRPKGSTCICVSVVVYVKSYTLAILCWMSYNFLLILINKMSRWNRNILLAIERWYTITNDWRIIGITWNRKSEIRKNSWYLHFSLWWIKWKKIFVPIHRFVAYQIYWDVIFARWVEVRHLDGNKDNNSKTNIAIWTHSDNMMDIPKHKRIEMAKRAASFVKKRDHDVIKNLHKSWVSYKNIMNMLWIKSKWTISWIINKSSNGIVI